MDEIQNELRYRRGGSSMSVILHSTENASMVVFKPIFAILIYYIIFLHWQKIDMAGATERTVGTEGIFR